MAALTAYLVAFFVSAVPPSEHRWREPENVTLARYESVAEDIAAVALDEEPVFDGDDGRERTALLLASIATAESALRADVDTCRVRGGRAVTVFQLEVRPRAVCDDRREAARVALRMVRESLAMCRRSPAAERLALYTSGHCDRGLREARWRWDRAASWWRAHPFYASVTP